MFFQLAINIFNIFIKIFIKMYIFNQLKLEVIYQHNNLLKNEF